MTFSDWVSVNVPRNHPTELHSTSPCGVYKSILSCEVIIQKARSLTIVGNGLPDSATLPAR